MPRFLLLRKAITAAKRTRTAGRTTRTATRGTKRDCGAEEVEEGEGAILGLAIYLYTRRGGCGVRGEGWEEEG